MRSALYSPIVPGRPPQEHVLGKGTVGLMAVAAGLFVASIYYNQPMLGILAREFHTGADGVAYVAVMTQVGYACGLVFLASLGDRFERRGLIVVTTLALSLTLALAALAPSLSVLTLASLGVGLMATVAQQVVPMAAHLAPENQRGQVVGTVMAGILTGILLGRTVSGLVSEYASWREMFGLASAATLVMAGVLAVRLPRSEPTVRVSSPRVLASLGGLMRSHELLRRSGLVQGLLFAAFVAFWTNVSLFLEAPPFSQGSAAAGLLGLLGVAGILAAPLVGRLIDKRGKGQERMIVGGALAVAASFALFGLFPRSWTALLAGVVLMDIGMQTSMISNQSRVYALDPLARSRLNTVYMTIMFALGAAGAAVGAQAFAHFGWTGTSIMGGSCGLLAVALEASKLRRP